MDRLPSIDDIAQEWSIDSKTDATEAGKELLRVGSLHSKYARILANHSLMAKKRAVEYNELKAVKYDYYNGVLPKEDLDARGWQPFLRTAKTKDVIERLCEADSDLNTILLKKAIHDEATDMCKSILKEVNNRTWAIRSWVDYQKLMKGEL